MLATRRLCTALARPRPSPSNSSFTSSSRFPSLLNSPSTTTLNRTPLLTRFVSSTPPPPPPPPRPSSSSSSSSSSRAYQSARQAHYARRNRTLLLYTTSTIILAVSATYLAVPLYRVFCSATGFAGTPTTDLSRFGPERLVAINEGDRRIRVHFNADSSDALPWSFTPSQKEVRVLPGETALAFYTATNHSKEDIIGIATYNVTPDKIAPYFAKVECFCFEEQRILAGEEVNLPVFFFIDQDFLEDPLMKDVKEVTLSYTFFRARRDNHGNLVPSEGPLAVEGSVPVLA